LGRGYAYLLTEDGAPALSARALRAGQRFTVRMRDGTIDAVAERVRVASEDADPV
jgi:exonuclease VII large subunit